MREFIQFECTECKNRNYTGTKNKKKQSGRIELSKFCKKCRKHNLHREMK